VILAALAVWEDGSYEILHYEIATAAGAGEWVTFLGHLIERGLEAEAVEIVVSDGCLGLPKAMNRALPQAQQQGCMTHKVRGLDRYLSNQQLPETNEEGEPLKLEQAKRQRRFEIKSDAYKIYASKTEEQAQQELQQFIDKWETGVSRV